MNEFITIGGKDYHADYNGQLLLDPDTGQPIESYICICAAWNSSECVCGAWDVPLPDEIDQEIDCGG